MNALLSGKIDRNIAPWLSGAPLTALHKKTGGICPIAVGDVIQRLVVPAVFQSNLIFQALSFRMVKLELAYVVGWKLQFIH